MSPKRRVVPAILVVILLAAAAPAAARVDQAFPRERVGTSLAVTAGGGLVAGHPYRTRSAVILWSRKWHTLTLYLMRQRKVNCRRLARAVQAPGHLIQVHVTKKTHVKVGRPMAHPEVAFVTVYRDPTRPEHIAGLKRGAKLTFERVDSYPHGIWRGRFSLPTRLYGDGLIYGYDGSFAARFCQMKR